MRNTNGSEVYYGGMSKHTAERSDRLGKTIKSKRER